MEHTPTIVAGPSARQVERLLTPKQIAEQLQCSYSMVLALIRRGDLRAVHVGRLRRVRELDLFDYVDRAGGQ